ncbi:MAG: 2-phosphosulfolactate phosphatase, partial [Chlorobi bacterium]|nr:2-phosphosulfolactate phosphatase [Chlorobiota bacterium]
KDKYSLSPASLVNIEKGKRLILSSPNGAELALSTCSRLTLCACLRNCQAVAEYAMQQGESILVVPAGEKWDDGSIRFSLEDYIGSGAVISFLQGNFSMESKSAVNLFNSFKDNLFDGVSNTISGIELIKRGFEEDISIASEFNVSKTVPLLRENSFINRG